MADTLDQEEVQKKRTGDQPTPGAIDWFTSMMAGTGAFKRPVSEVKIDWPQPAFSPRVPDNGSPDTREAMEIGVPKSVGQQYERDRAAGFPIGRQEPVQPPPSRFPPPGQEPAQDFALPPLGGTQTASTGEPGEQGLPSPDPDLPLPKEFREEPGATPPQRDAWARDPQFKDTMPTTFGEGPKGVAALGPGALSALYGQKLQALQDASDEQQEARAAKAEQLALSLPQRRALEQIVESARREYEEGLRTARPDAPELKKIPPAPDVKIRPWLDPEGKDAISVIAQTLGMLAVGVAGVYYRAPVTAMKWFREAAEAWRRDEVDAANSKLKQFETEVTRIKGDNETALKQYEIADKQYAHNLDAKKAMVLSKLDGMKLHDEATLAALLPYEEAISATKERIDSTGKILTHLEKYMDIAQKAAKTGSNIPASMFKLQGELDGLRGALPSITDPEQRKQTEQRIGVLEATKKHYGEFQTQQARERAMAGQDSRESALLQRRMDQVPFYVGALRQLKQDYITLQEAGLLPTGPTRLQGWIAKIKQELPGKWNDKTAAAFRGIEQFYPEFVIGTARTFWNDIGVRTKDAFGPLQGQAISFSQAMGYIDRAGARLKEFTTFGTHRMAELDRRLRTGEPTETTTSLPGAVTDDEDVDAPAEE